uniref:Dihydrolipoyllysine-residue succinyltransferase component of 2-oxoglutarate dehydrogenase complex n=1 Tax=Candidatus Kentrum sp. TUN TaxID=2126343 RepID=A0A450ZAF6_9GAMM|nr:MAG: 2-oxoglutarate dehydrogenase E2 component [Candidatus Kentron sp. TUN]VFK50981.1 MAG: 2-oxoglutarate dehydrogenase E2 component [Candidatus Kentron sp. TUN]VFK51958.1 MAG: 2-oxoglutarate dehydrogenase E2 component [Candidatus Kentron sp. TUN]
MIDIKVPTLPESVPDATLLGWKKNVGSPVVRDELLVELETDKVVLEIPAPQDGILKEILRQGGQQVQAGDVIAKLDADLDKGTDKDAMTASSADKPTIGKHDESIGVSTELSPTVRKLVAEHDLDTKTILGTGRDGRITKGDVLAYLESQELPSLPKPSVEDTSSIQNIDQHAVSGTLFSTVDSHTGPRAERRVPMSKIRARIAQRLLEAQQTAAILTTFNEANLQSVMELRERFRTSFEKKYGVRLGFMSFFVKAVVQALQQFPIINASLEGSDIVYHDYYDLGVAVGSPRGLVVPVIRDCNSLSFAEIEAKIVEFGEKANTAQLGIDELSGGTFTITNGGIFGSLMSTPILNPPQSAILGMHKIQDRPIAENGQIVIRSMMYLALSYDHRLIDGQDAVRFLVAIKEAVEDPHRLLLEV